MKKIQFLGLAIIFHFHLDYCIDFFSPSFVHRMSLYSLSLPLVSRNRLSDTCNSKYNVAVNKSLESENVTFN